MEAWTELSPRNLGALHGCSRKRLMSPDYSESNMTRPSTPKRYKQSGGNIRLYGPEQVWATPQAVRPASIPISLFDRCHQQISTPLIIRSINGVNQISKISNFPYIHIACTVESRSSVRVPIKDSCQWGRAGYLYNGQRPDSVPTLAVLQKRPLRAVQIPRTTSVSRISDWNADADLVCTVQ